MYQLGKWGGGQIWSASPETHFCAKILERSEFLPHTFRRNGEGNVFTGVCPFTPGEGGGVPGLRSRLGGWVTPSQVWIGGYPILLMGSTPPQVWMGGAPSQVWTGGVPHPGLDGEMCPHPADRGVPPSKIRTGGTLGYPLPRTGWGTPPVSKASTCYAAGGVPLAFT